MSVYYPFSCLHLYICLFLHVSEMLLYVRVCLIVCLLLSVSVSVCMSVFPQIPPAYLFDCSLLDCSLIEADEKLQCVRISSVMKTALYFILLDPFSYVYRTGRPILAVCITT